jgi:type I restriction enzyme R subunit
VIKSPNFSFLSLYDPLLLDLTATAELYCFSEPVVALIRLRLFGETMALQTAAAVAAFPHQERVADFSTALRLLEDKNAISRETAQIFHHLRQVGSRAAHENVGSRGDALHALRLKAQAEY